MRRHAIPNGWYCHALPSGTLVATIGRHVDRQFEATHVVDDRARTYDKGLLFVRCTDADGFKFAGQADRTWEWHGEWEDHEPIGAMNPVIYDRLGQLLKVDRSRVNSAQGFRFLDPVTGVPVYGEATVPVHGYEMHEWTDLGGGLRVGQAGPGCCLTFGDGTYYVLERGTTLAIRGERDGDHLAISMYTPDGPFAIMHWLTLAEVHQLPIWNRSAAPEYSPIPPINRAVWFGAYSFGRPSPDLPQNCTIRVALGQTRAPIHDLAGREIAYYVAGHPGDGDIHDIERAIREERAAGHTDIVAYLPKSVQDMGVFSSADVQGLEMYWRKGETAEAFVARVRRSFETCRIRGWQVAAIPQLHSSNPGLETDLRLLARLVVPIIIEFADVVRFILLFSAGDGRQGGWNDNPQYHEDWSGVFASITTPESAAPPGHDPDEPTEDASDSETQRPRTRLRAGDRLRRGEVLVSQDGRTKFDIQRGDGHPVVSRDGVEIYAFPEFEVDDARMGGDGNLGFYAARNVFLSHTFTYGHLGAWLEPLNDGRLVIFDLDGAVIWERPEPAKPTAPLPPQCTATDDGYRCTLEAGHQPPTQHIATGFAGVLHAWADAPVMPKPTPARPPKSGLLDFFRRLFR